MTNFLFYGELVEVRMIWKTEKAQVRKYMGDFFTNNQQEMLELASAEEILAFIARISNPTQARDKNTNPQKLLAYMMEHKHWSPFTMVNACLEIITTRTITHQMVRHSLLPQEFSQRYSTVSSQPVVLTPARKVHPTNRQMSVDLVGDDLDLVNQWISIQKDIGNRTRDAYEWALKKGIAKEVARVVLPEGMTPSVIAFNGTARQWYHYLQARLRKDEVQREHYMVAELLQEELCGWIPALFSMEALGFETKEIGSE